MGEKSSRCGNRKVFDDIYRQQMKKGTRPWKGAGKRIKNRTSETDHDLDGDVLGSICNHADRAQTSHDGR